MQKFVLLVIASVLLFASVARADEAADARADALFQEGRKLMDGKQYAEACAKFDESYKLSPSGGAELNLAECNDKIENQRALGEGFKDVAKRAATANKKDIAKYANDKAAEMEKRMARLVIQPARADLAGLEIRRDTIVIDKAQWNSPIPLDPGKYVIRATATGRKDWSTSVDMPATGGEFVVAIPVTEEEGAQPFSKTNSLGDSAPSSGIHISQKTIGLIVGGVGIVGVGVGVVFGLQAKSKNDDALQHCSGSTCTDQTGVDLTNDAKTDATISTIFVGAGLAAIAGGAILYFTAPSPKSNASKSASPDFKLRNLRVNPAIGSNSGSLSLSGAW